jgi:hypothetical protein
MTSNDPIKLTAFYTGGYYPLASVWLLLRDFLLSQSHTEVYCHTEDFLALIKYWNT